MKKFLIAAFAIGIALTAQAEGYQVNTLSARQGGMGHTGVALHLGAESQYFNPAGLGFMTETLDASASFNALSPYAKCRTNGKWYESDNDISTPLMGAFAMSINSKFKAGVSFYTPYGSNINWGTNWPGAELNQKVKLAAFTVQPTFAWQIIENHLSVGAGLTMSWGTVDLYKGLISAETFGKVVAIKTGGQSSWPEGLAPASAYLNGKSDLSLGFNVGIMCDINKMWSVGAGFRSTSWLKVKTGSAKVLYPEGVSGDVAKQFLAPSLNNIDESEFDAKMPLPYVLTLGVACRPIDRLTLAADVQFTDWHAYKTLDVVFHKPELGGAFDQHIAKDYKSSMALRLGAKYAINEKFDVRAGVAFDQSPINDAHYNPETPGMTKVEPAIGFTYHTPFGLNVNLAALYVAGLGVDGAECDFEDLMIKNNKELQAIPGFQIEKTFVGDYRVHAFNIALGLSYSF